MLEGVRLARVRLLFVSPEKVLSSAFQTLLLEQLPAPGLALVCVDEAHCVSQWSHNFRPSYLRLHSVLFDVLRAPRVLALTATATRASSR